jgi:hypothetical protein
MNYKHKITSFCCLWNNWHRFKSLLYNITWRRLAPVDMASQPVCGLKASLGMNRGLPLRLNYTFLCRLVGLVKWVRADSLQTDDGLAPLTTP